MKPLTHTIKHILATFALLLCSICLPLMVQNAYAAEEVASGTCGDNLTWVLDENGVLTISGTGEMKNYESDNNKSPFINNAQIKEVIVETGVTTIGSCAFYMCNNIEVVSLADSVSYLGAESFYGCSSMARINIPNGISSINYASFWDCRKLTSISLPDGLVSIGYRAFNGCESLSNINFPNSLTTIESDAFTYCRALENISFSNNLKSIGGGAFQNCTSLTSVSIPFSVETIDTYAFTGCTNLQRIDVNTNNENYSSEDGVLYNKSKTNLICCPGGKKQVSISNSTEMIETSAFSSSSLTNVIIPFGVKSIGYGAFALSGNLTSVDIPSSVNSIGANAFSQCYRLTNITIPEGITEISNGVFSYCSDLRDIKIPDGVESIGDTAFQNCSTLSTITIPNSLISIGNEAFIGCYNIDEVYYEGNENEWHSISIGDENTNLTHATIIFEGGSSGSEPGSEGETNTFTISGKTFTHDLDYYANNLSTSSFSNELCSLMAAINCCVGSEDGNRNENKKLGFTGSNFRYYDEAYLFHKSITFSIDSKRKNGKRIILINMRGTGNISDVQTDIALTNPTDSNYSTHAGFQSAADYVMKSLVSYLGKEPEPDRNTKYFVTGHSLGAATANLFSAELSHKVGKDCIYNYNFACPNTLTSNKSIVDDPDAFNPMNAHSNQFNICRTTDQFVHMPGLVSSVLLDAKEHIQYGWDIFQCFHKKRDFYWGKWGITKWFDDGIVMPWNAHDMGKYLNYVSESTPDYSASIVFGDAFTYAVNNVFIFCPVDAYLIDEKGDVVAAIINNEPVLYNEEDLAVQIAIAGDEKCISYPANRKYKLEMEATGSGTMGYVVAQGNPDDEMFSGCAIYQNISLTNGRKIRSIIDSEKVENSSIYGEDEDGSIQSDIQPNGTEIKHVHEWNSRYSVDESATCNKDGSESIHCSKCDAVKEGSERIIPAIGHNWGEWITTIAPTETAAGQQSRTCSVCGFTETQEIPQLTPSTQAVAPAASAVIVDLPAVKISKPSAGKKKITVKWKKVSKKNLKKISGIQIQVATDPNFTNIVKTATAGKKKTSKIIKGLSSKTKYYVRIRAYAADNHVSAWKVKSVKVK